MHFSPTLESSKVCTTFGIQVEVKYYFDLVMVMECRIAPYICQRTTNMISYIYTV